MTLEIKQAVRNHVTADGTVITHEDGDRFGVRAPNGRQWNSMYFTAYYDSKIKGRK